MRLPTLPLAIAIAAHLACMDDGGVAPAPAPVSAPATPGAVENTLAEVIADMDGAHEGFPRGVLADGGDAWAWVYHPRVGYGNDLPAGWNATVPWGQVYADTSGTPTAGTRFQLRGMQQWMLRRADSTWVLVVDVPDDLAGANYAEDFQNDANVPAGLRREPDSLGGGISAAIQDGYNFHFFAKDRAEIDPDDVAGMYSVFEARLLPGQAPAAYAPALIASGGGDYWEATDSAWDQWTTNGDWAIGRFKYLTPEWRSFNAHTLDAETLRRYPPPPVAR